MEGITVPNDASGIILANCTGFTISGINASNIDIGIQIGYSSYNHIHDNYITFNNEDGISMGASEHNIVNNNYISDNYRGVGMGSSPHNTISDNTILYNYEGIDLTWSSYNNTITRNYLSFNSLRAIGIAVSSNRNMVYNNEIFDNHIGIDIDSMPPFFTKENIIYNNNITYNTYGVLLESTSDNIIYQNNFIDNFIQARDDQDDNHWDSGYPSGGNYWNDYSGSDFFSGPNQDQSDGDGIGDVPYEIDSDSLDNYPLMIPWMPDRTPPVIELLSPSNNSIIRPGTSILFSITDESILTVTYSVDQGSYQTLEPPYEIDTSQLNEGIFAVEVQAIDIYHNSIGKSYIFTIDTDSPEVSLVSPGNNSYITAGIPIIFTAFDQHLDKVICTVEGSNPQELNEPYELDTDDWNDGNYEVLLNASDLAGNFILGYYNFTIDSTMPEIMLISPHNNSFLSENLELSFAIFEDNILTSKYSKNKGSWVSFSEPYQIEMEKWTDGEYLIDIQVEDMAENKIKKWFVFTKDTIGPNIILNSPDNNTLILEDSNIDFIIEEENLNSVVYSVNHGIFNTLIEPYDLDISSWEDGEYTITIRAEDHGGLSIERWFVFRIDTEVPSIAMTFPLSDSDDIVVDVIIIIGFSESMDPDSVEKAISISPDIEYLLQWENDNRTMVINFPSSMDYDTQYLVSISKKAEDMAGRALENKYELEFTTQEKPINGDGDGLPIIFLILTLAIAGLAAIIIVVFVVAKKRKAPGKVGSGDLHTGPESSNTIQFTCSKCNNLLQAIDNGLTQNVSCPYCSTLLTIQSQWATSSTSQVQTQAQTPQSTVQISCPQCKHSFNVNNTGGLTSIKCPNCGLSGTVNMGGTTPQKPPSTSMPTQQIRCPGCQKMFNIQTDSRPVTIQCPHCGITGTLN
jgi:parallel beta-helix repeat protein